MMNKITIILVIIIILISGVVMKPSVINYLDDDPTEECYHFEKGEKMPIKCEMISFFMKTIPNRTIEISYNEGEGFKMRNPYYNKSKGIEEDKN